MKTHYLKKEQLHTAAVLLQEGRNVIFPTETVYGLGARYDNIEAIRGVFHAKNRPMDNPLIVHIYRLEQLDELVEEITPCAKALMEAFWPGPLSLIMKKKASVPLEVTGGLDSVAIRMPNHPIARELLEKVDIPIAAPSANQSGHVSPTKASHLQEMDGRVSAIILGDDSEVGIESTVVDVQGEYPMILRPGVISENDIRSVCGKVIPAEAEAKKRSPGLRYKHYSPIKDVIQIQGSYEQLTSFIESHPEDVFVLTPQEQDLSRFSNVWFLYSKEDKDFGAHRIFSLLHAFDQSKYGTMYIKIFEKEDKNVGVLDRIERASGYQKMDLEEL